MIDDEYSRDIKEAPLLIKKRATHFCRENKEQLKQIKEIINHNTYLLLELIEPRYIGKQRYNSDSMQLIDQAIRLNLTSYELIKRTNFFEAIILYRGITEFCSVAIAINKDSKVKEKFKNEEKFSSTSTMQIAKRYIGEIAKIWGDLSNLVVHVNPTTHGTKKYHDHNGEIAMQQFFLTSLYRDKELDSNLILNQLEMMTYLILYCIEVVCFHKVTKDSETYTLYADGKKQYLGKNGEENFKRVYSKIFVT